MKMTDRQWDQLLKLIKGEPVHPVPVGFIIDSPWLPNWAGISILDYFSHDDLWFHANRKAIEAFPSCSFLPGFWAELGMCTEPSAFGSRCRFPVNEFPHAFPCIRSTDDIDSLTKPRPDSDGLLPFILNRLKLNRSGIEALGHKIRFSVSRGPLNIAAHLMGTTEFLMAMMTEPQRIHQLLRLITDFLIEWHDLQKKTFDTIDGIFLLDDIIGFIGSEHFMEFGLPYLQEIYDRKASVKFLHNDAGWESSAEYLPEMGVNLFNMTFESNLNDLKILTRNQVAMMGNIPPRDVLARGTVNDIRDAVTGLLGSLDNVSHVLLSCGGGMPPDVTTEQVQAFIEAVPETPLPQQS
jgi:uroporphyrinogen decarboxylase